MAPGENSRYRGLIPHGFTTGAFDVVNQGYGIAHFDGFSKINSHFQQAVRQELGWQPGDFSETLRAMSETMVAQGVVSRESAGTSQGTISAVY